jgi:3-isopropylmalate/(R)-2-methylmalate dehydratase large subunit
MAKFMFLHPTEKKEVEMPMTSSVTLFEKIWDDHVITDFGDSTYLIYVDRHFLHEMSGALSFKEMEEAGQKVCRPEQTFATVDHVVNTAP